MKFELLNLEMYELSKSLPRFQMQMESAPSYPNELQIALSKIDLKELMIKLKEAEIAANIFSSRVQLQLELTLDEINKMGELKLYQLKYFKHLQQIINVITIPDMPVEEKRSLKDDEKIDEILKNIQDLFDSIFRIVITQKVNFQKDLESLLH